MKVLFIGGTGNISTYCSRELLKKGAELVLLNRGSSAPVYPEGEARFLRGDVNLPGGLEKALRDEKYDAVVNWIAYTPDQVRRDIAFFRDRTAQYLFISSASAYRKPPLNPVITESTPLANPFWDYSRQKIVCENLLTEVWRDEGFPMTIVRPSHTYGHTWLPTSFGSTDFTVPARMIDGREVPVHGDGQSVWTLTHASDFARGFAGLVGLPEAVGEAYHITSDEHITWDMIHTHIASALGAEARIVHLPVEFIARRAPAFGDGLKGDKRFSVIFDNSKIKRAVPSFKALVPFSEGIRRSVDYLNEHPELKVIDREKDALIDRMIAEYRGFLA
jgi:nucleoside-diphosphate-sugar epimerase